MTATIRPEHLDRAAQIAAERGVEIVIESEGRVYRITPARQGEAVQAAASPLDAWRAKRGQGPA